MSAKREILHVIGMTCSACEARVEKALLGTPGVIRASASTRGGRVEIEYEADRADRGSLEAAIRAAGYGLRAGSWGGSAMALGVGILLAAAYLVADSMGAFNAFPSADSSIGFAMLFAIGLLTSVHCVAMCGGIAISQSLAPLAPSSDGATVKASARILPGVLYNAGRVISYTIIGGLAGGLGAAFDFSPAAKGAITGVAALFMVLLGLKMLGILPSGPRLGEYLPPAFSKALSRLSEKARSRGPFVVGLLNGLVPCGPLQTMQLYALGTGSALSGALSLFLFALGTVPLMLAFGAAAALLPRKVLPSLVKASAVLVLVLGFLTAGRAAALAGIALPGLASTGRSAENRERLAADTSPIGTAAEEIPMFLAADAKPPAGIFAKVKGESQEVLTEFKNGRYLPFTVQAGLPVTWIVRIKESELTNCNNALVVPAYGIRKRLVPGDNVIEFLPQKTGVIAYSCWMGMIRSMITVVEDISKVKSAFPGKDAEAPATTGKGGRI